MEEADTEADRIDCPRQSALVYGRKSRIPELHPEPGTMLQATMSETSNPDAGSRIRPSQSHCAQQNELGLVDIFYI